MTTDAKPQKSTIYLDAEDEITAIIDKVKSAHGSIVAVVPPKRAAALQSVVNLKLLQRAARNAKKNLVLVTTEPALLPLAGTVGMMVAKTTSSKPEVPPAPDAPTPPDEIDEVVETGEAPIDTSTPVGVLAGGAAVASLDDVETVELDSLPADSGASSDKASPKSKKDKKANKPDKKLKVPNFNTFRKKMLLAGAALVLLIVLFVFANIILPSAEIVIKTDTASVQSNLNITSRTSATEVDTDNLVVPLIREEFKKTDTEKAPATGKRDDGTKASGSVTFSIECGDVDGAPPTIPAGTAVSSNNLNFITQSNVSLSTPAFSPCRFTGSTNVVAQENGDQYNLSERSYDVSEPSVTAFGSTMSGGTSKMVKVVSQSDIDGARQKILDRIKNDGEAELKSKFDEQGAIGLADTLKSGEPVVTASPNANSEGDEVNVSVSVTYTQAAVRRDDVNKLIESDVQRQIDTSKQQLQDTGLDAATLRVTSDGANELRFQLQSVSQAGPQLDAEGIKQEIAGKKRGETESLILARPGIRDVEINYSPFWVHGTPSRTGKITITFESANAQQ
jgi:hypothetical protein